MAFLEMAAGAEVLAIASAIATLTSSFSEGAELVQGLKTRWRDQGARGRIAVAEFEKLERSLVLANSTVQGAYDSSHARYGQRFHVGDDLARYILFALAAGQEALLRNLQSGGFERVNNNIQRLIANVDRTKTAAASCLNELDARIQLSLPPPQLSLQEKTALLMDYQNLCSSAVLYRTGQVSHSQLVSASSNNGKWSCHQCRAILTPSKISIPGADTTSYALINLSGLFRAHCHAGSGWTCIWQLRVPPCYGVFPDEKALLKHMLAVHVRDDGSEGDIEVDWPADIRRGDLQKCGYSVRINGLQMRDDGGNLVVPKRLTAINMSVSNESSFLPSARISAVDVNFSKSSTLSVTATEIGPFEAEPKSPVSALEMDPAEAEERWPVTAIEMGHFRAEQMLPVTATEMNPSESRPRNEISSNEIFEMES